VNPTYPTLLALAAHYRFEPRPVAVARGNEKGRVERAIRSIRDAFFAARAWRGHRPACAQLRCRGADRGRGSPRRLGGGQAPGPGAPRAGPPRQGLARPRPAAAPCSCRPPRGENLGAITRALRIIEVAFGEVTPQDVLQMPGIFPSAAVQQPL
jgi:hypothetical protein